MATLYRKFLKLLEHWPVDSTKFGRDLGQHIRDQVKEAFKKGEVFEGDERKCEKIYASLKRLADNRYYEQHPRKLTSSASGLSAEECKAIMSSEFLEELEKAEQGFISKLFFTVKKKDKSSAEK